ncbi:MAG TPA: hypothetical protein VK166_16185 [Chitinophagaceae bacterium]|nr:hypothetical protein [Chitinophagaceae bacterium]
MKRTFLVILISLLACYHANAQSITGVWRGKVSRGIKIYNLELKLIKSGDSLTGTSYYYHSPSNYSRFRVKGYFDISGDIVWWDKELIESKGGKISSPNTTPFRFAADFNCPGDDIMKLDGTADKNGDSGKDHEVHLSKVEDPFFKDEWDEVIGDFPYYASVPDYIDSVERSSLAFAEPPPPPVKEPMPEKKSPPKPVEPTVAVVAKTEAPAPEKKNPPRPVEPPVAVAAKTEIPEPEKNSPHKPVETPTPGKTVIPVSIAAPKTIVDKFVERKKILVEEILVSGDSIRLDFYDNAEIDGDSISLFLNGKMIHQHVLLKASPFEFKIAVTDLAEENELTMVAENLGSIPPNTSLMLVWVNGERHEARLESTENSSAMIRFRKKPAQ